MIRQTFQKSIDGLPAALSSIQGIVDPLKVSFFCISGKIGRIEKYQIERSSDSQEQISSHDLNSLGLCCPDSMRVYVRREEALNPKSQFSGDKAAAATDLKHAILWPRLDQGAIEKEKSIFLRRINLLGSKL